MKNYLSIVLVILMVTAYATSTCSQHCDECDESGTVCFACGGAFEVNVFGGCHANTIDKCTIYGPSDQCFRCQPTYSLINSNKCDKIYNGCVNEGSPGQCFQCGFGMLIDGNKCKGILNCQQQSGSTCKKCKDGYKLQGNLCKDTTNLCLQFDNGSGTCKKCKDGNFLSGYKCFDKKYKNDRCYILKDQTKCMYCKGGYNEVDGKCLLNKQMPQFGNGATMMIVGGNGFDSGSGSGGFSSFSNGGSSDFGASTGSQQIMSTSGVNTISFDQHTSTTSTASSGFDQHDNGFSSFNQQQASASIANCQVPDASSGGCLICVYGFFPSGKTCEQVSQLCDGHNVQTGACFGCKFDLSLQSGKCVDKNCNKLVGDKCQQCKPGYKLNQQSICKQYDPNCLQSANGRCQQCKPQYYTDISGKCKQLPPYCSAANIQTGSCLQCIKDYQMQSPGSPCVKKLVIQNCEVLDSKNYGKCLICVYGYYPQGTKCNKVSILCKDFNVQNGKCKTCLNDAFKLQDGKCIDYNCANKNGDLCTSCKPNFAYSQPDKICKYTDINCKTSTITQCKQCKPGYYLSSSICKQLPANCQSASPAGSCSSCVSGYEVYNGGCIKTIVIANCGQVDSVNSRCVSCNDRYYQPTPATCVLVDDRCKGYDRGTGKCTSCKGDMVLKGDGTCANPPPPPPVQVTPAPPINANNQQGQLNGGYTYGQTINIQGQQQQGSSYQNSQSSSSYNQGTSNSITTSTSQPTYNQQQQQGTSSQSQPVYGQQQQQSGIYSSSTSSSQPVYNQQGTSSSTSSNSYSDQNCREWSGNKCSKCSARMYVGPQGKCVPANPLCKQNNQQGDCTACYPGYKIFQGKCIIGSSSNDPNCKTQLSQGCQQCYQGFYYNVNQKICKKLNPLCRTSNKDTGACVTCYNGYAVNANNGNCQVSFKDPYCQQSNPDSTCKKCVDRYYINPQNSKCSAVSTLCRNYSMSNGQCTDCYPGYGLTPDGKCDAGYSQDPNCKVPGGASGCKQCVKRYYTGTDGKCKVVNPLCNTYDSTNGACLTCYNGYQVSGALCVQQKSKDPYCRKFAKPSVCQQCYSGFVPISGKCQPQNPLCRTLNYTTGACLTCWPGYAPSSDTCVPETSTPVYGDQYCIKFDMKGVCLVCANGYFYNRTAVACNILDSLCKSWNMQTGQCATCYSGYGLTNTVPNKCTPVQSIQLNNCANIGNNGQCLQCNQGCYLSNGQCKQGSLTCSSINKRTGQCLACITGHVLQDGSCIFPALYDINCMRYQSAYCSKCKDGFYINNYMCLAIDANCTDFDERSAMCNQCANGMYPSGSTCV